MEIDPYKELLEEIPEFIYVHDIEGKFITINSAVKSLGIKKEALLNHKASEFIHPSYKDQFKDYISETISKGETEGLTLIVDGSGKKHILKYHSKLIIRDGRPVGIQGMARDVTEQKRIERDLQERETLYRTLFEHAEDAIFLMERNLFVDCNPKALKMFGCRKDDIIGKPPYLFSPKFQLDGRPSEEKAVEKIQAALDGKPQRFEWQHTRLDGTPFDAIVSLYRIEVYKRKIIVAMVHDISLQKETVMALRESEKKYREVAEAANTAIIRFTTDGVFTFINRFGEELFGYSREELVGKRRLIGTIIPEKGEGSDDLKAMFRDLCAHPERYYENENKNMTKDGKEVYVAWRNQPIRDKDGKVLEILSIGADITKIRRLEKELLQSKKLEAVGTLAGGVAHDFNNILGGMMGYISLLKNQHELGDRHYEILEKLEKEGIRASNLVRQLLAFSRRGKYESKAIDINQRVQSVLGILKRSIPKKIDIDVNLRRNLPATKGDPSQIDQVIMNTCLNSIQAMPDGGILGIKTSLVASKDIQSKLAERGTAGSYIELSISDTGIGMDKFTKEHIFEPFFTTKGVGEGIGLGLSTVYGIMRNHGGAVTVESEKGSGATFRIYFPATDIHLEKGKAGMTVSTNGAIKGKGKILVADDEDLFRDMLKDVLEYLGYDVLLAKNGREGVEIFKDHQDVIDLVILDMNMPIMDGGEMFRELKKLNSSVKALLATGFTLNGQAQELMNEGVMGFIQKPFRIEEISKAIDTLMKVNA